MPTPTPPPAGVTVRALSRVSAVMPAPVLVDGRPSGWAPTSIVEENWGRLQVVVGGTDVTFFRGVPTIVESWSSAEPYGDATGVIRFPQITPFDTPGTGALSWLVDWANVEINRVLPDGTTTEVLWEGLLPALEEVWDEDKASLSIVGMGALHQLSLYRRAPGTDDNVLDIGALIANQWQASNRPALRTQDMASVGTAIGSRYRGGWESALEYVSKLLELAATNAGDQWTVAHDRPRLPVLRLKDRTTVNWTVTAGQPGVAGRLQRELSSAVNTYYGEGVDPGGIRWRNSRSQTPTGLWFQPISYDTAVHGYDEGVGGTIVDNTARVDPAKIRIESFTAFGDGVSIADGKAAATAQRLRGQDPGWVGTLTLRIDPEQGSRLAIRAGHNILVKAHRGVDRLFHVASVQVDMGSDGVPSVALTVDTKARDLPTVAAILQRQRDVATNPLVRLLRGRDSGSIKAEQVPWDSSAGAGWVPTARKFNGTSTVALTANTWTIVRFLASERDTIVRTEMVTSPGVRFSAAVFADSVSAANLPSDPFAAGAWDDISTQEPSYQMHWGQNGEGAGYTPGMESLGGAVTGRLVDDGTWQYSHDGVADGQRQPAYLWLAVFPQGASNLWAEFTRGVGY